jgi:hypothetical protein
MVKNGTCVDKIRRRILASNRANPTPKKHSPHDGSNLDARTKGPDDDEKRLLTTVQIAMPAPKRATTTPATGSSAEVRSRLPDG